MADRKSRLLAVSGSVGGSSRARQMLAMATKPGGKGGSKTPGGAAAGPPPVVFSRRQKQQQKRETEEDSLFTSLQSTPKKQRMPSPDSAARPVDAPSAPRPPPSLGLAPPARPLLRDTTCTQRITCYDDKQRLREQWQEGEEMRRRRLYSGGGSSGAMFRRSGGGEGVGAGRPRLPAGMANLGNTCYMNAVLQVLLSLPCFVADLRRGKQLLEAAGQPLSSTGLYSALLECLAARDSSRASCINPASLKRALDASSATFQGALQQDAHELLVSLLDGVQSEVLAREVARLGRTCVRISETEDPAARNFSFAVQHELTCRQCGHSSQLVEEYMHLSLELPEAQPGSVAASSIAALLKDYFKEEEVEKSCDGCGGCNLPHSLRHCIKRLPRVLVLHMKRFQVSWNAERQQTVCQKLHTQVAIPDSVQLSSFLATGALPPLPGGQQQEAGKENQQLDANAGAPTQQQEQGTGPADKSKLMPRRSGVSFYGGGGGGMGTPVAASALLSPADCGLHQSPALRGRQATPAAFKLSRLAEDEEDVALQQALAASMLEADRQREREREPLLPAHMQLQRQASLPDAGGLVRCHGADAEECPLIRAAPSSPCSTAGAAAAVLPPELEAAAAAGPAAAHGSGAGAGCGLQEPRWMGIGRSATAAGSHSAFKTAEQQAEEDLQRVLELSRLEHEQHLLQQQAAAEATAAVAGSGSEATPAASLAGLAAAAAEDSAAAGWASEEADLQRAMELSLLDQPGAGGSSGVMTAAGGVAQHAAQQAQQQEPQQQEPQLETQQEQSCHVFAGILRKVVREPSGSSEPAAAGAGSSPAAERQQRAAAAAAAGEIGRAQAQAEDEVTEVMEEGLDELEGAANGATSAAAVAAEEEAGMETAGAAEQEGAGGAAAAAYLHVQIVEDDDPLLQQQLGGGASAAGSEQDGNTAAAAAAGFAANGSKSGPTALAAGGSAALRKPPAAAYRLQAVVNHKGPAAACGHFTSDIRDPASGQWHWFDDSVASRISPAEACSSEKQRECYLLFYVM